MKIKPAAYLLIGLVILGGFFVILKPKKQTGTGNAISQATSSSQISTQPNSKIFELVVKSRKLVSGPETLKVIEGDNVTIKITADEDEELHLHGYDKMVDLTADKPAELNFTANLTGRFIYELEHSKTDIGALEVSPK